MDDCVIFFWFCVLWYFSVHNAERVQMAGGEGRILEDGGGWWRILEVLRKLQLLRSDSNHASPTT